MSDEVELTTPHGPHTQEVVASAHGLELGVLFGGVDKEKGMEQRIDYATIVNLVVEVRIAFQVMGRCPISARLCLLHLSKPYDISLRAACPRSDIIIQLAS
jgi:hypothetical protein